MVHGERHGRARRLRRLVQARRRVSASVADSEASVRSRGVSGRRFLPAFPPVGTRRAPHGKRLSDGAPDHRNAGGRRFRLHSHERHFDYGRADFPSDGFVQPGRAPGDFGRSFGLTRRFLGADQGVQAGRGKSQRRARAVSRNGGVRAVRERPRRGDEGDSRQGRPLRRAVQARSRRAEARRFADRADLGDAARFLCGRRAGKHARGFARAAGIS